MFLGDLNPTQETLPHLSVKLEMVALYDMESVKDKEKYNKRRLLFVPALHEMNARVVITFIGLTWFG